MRPASCCRTSRPTSCTTLPLILGAPSSSWCTSLQRTPLASLGTRPIKGAIMLAVRSPTMHLFCLHPLYCQDRKLVKDTQCHGS